MRVFVYLIFSFSLFATPKKLQVATTLQVLKWLVQEVGGEQVEVTALAYPDQDPHFVQPRPTLIQKLKKADCLVVIGMGLEGWVDKALEASANLNIQKSGKCYVDTSLGVQALEVPKQLSQALGDVHPQGNPHIWLDPLNVMIMGQNVLKMLGKQKPEHQKIFQERFESLKLKIEEKTKEWQQKATVLKNKNFVSYHNTWTYFSKRFSLSILGQIEDKPGISPTPKHQQEIIQKIRLNPVNSILIEPFYDRRAADFIAKQTNSRVQIVSIDLKERQNYFEYMDDVWTRLSN